MEIPLNFTHPKIEGVAYATLDADDQDAFTETELIIAMESVRGLAYIWKHPTTKSWLRPRIKRDIIQHNSDVLGKRAIMHVVLFRSNGMVTFQATRRFACFYRTAT